MPRIVAGGGAWGRPATRLKLAVLAGLCAAVTAMIWASSGADAQSAEPGRVAYVDVGVATLWVFLAFDQQVDGPAVSNPSDVGLWLENMSLGQEKRLVGDLETQALYGQRVVVLEEQGEWAKVAVEGQPTPRNASGGVPRMGAEAATDLRRGPRRLPGRAVRPDRSQGRQALRR